MHENKTHANKISITPIAEVLISLLIALIFYLTHKTELAQVSLIIGPTIALARHNISKKLETELQPIHKLAELVDLTENGALGDFENAARVYLKITEPELRRVKEHILEDALDQLKRLATDKKSGFLPTGQYYMWLLPMLEEVRAKQQVWAVSMMLDCEWDDSPPEKQFLQLNLKAAKTGAEVERVFVVPKALVSKLKTNIGVIAHLENESSTLRPLLVIREELERKDSKLLRDLGDGMIAFDRRVALVDKSAEDGIRGYVTLNTQEILRLRRLYDALLVYAVPLHDALESDKTLGHNLDYTAAKNDRSEQIVVGRVPPEI